MDSLGRISLPPLTRSQYLKLKLKAKRLPHGADGLIAIDCSSANLYRSGHAVMNLAMVGDVSRLVESDRL